MVQIGEMRRIAVIGAGTMGHGIAQEFARAGYQVVLQDLEDDIVQRATVRIEANLHACCGAELITSEEVPAIMGRIWGTADLAEAAADADFVVEAVAEDLDLKRRLFRELDGLCPRRTVLATNTSGLSITRIAAATARPDRVVGTHFWNPPHLIPLVEVVRGDETSDETTALACQIVECLGKSPVVVRKDVPGFVGNRLQLALLREALAIVEQGIASAADVDTVVKTGFGRRLAVIGPLETADLGGLDIFFAIARYLLPELDRSTEPPPLLAEKVRQGKLGSKTGKGFYNWTDEKAQATIAARDRELMRHLQQGRNLLKSPKFLEILKKKMTGAVSMYVEAVRTIQEVYGPEASETIRDSQMRKWVEGAAERAKSTDNSLRAFCTALEEGCHGSHEWEKVEDSDTRQAYRFTRCMWADVFRALGAEDIGIWICEGDGPTAAAFNPHIRFQRTKTLMEGDGCCDHVYYIEEG